MMIVFVSKFMQKAQLVSENELEGGDDSAVFAKMREAERNGEEMESFLEDDDEVTEEDRDRASVVLDKAKSEHASKEKIPQSQTGSRGKKSVDGAKPQKSTPKPVGVFDAATYSVTPISVEHRDEFLTTGMADKKPAKKRKLQIASIPTEVLESSVISFEESHASFIKLPYVEPVIVKDDPGYVVVSKPVGMSVASGTNLVHNETLLYWLGDKFGRKPQKQQTTKEVNNPNLEVKDGASEVIVDDAAKSGEGSSELKNIAVPSPQDKIDRYTSGLVVCPKNSSVGRFLFADFARERIRKEYLTILNGVPLTSVQPVGAKLIKPSKKSSSTKKAGPEAIAEWKPVLPFQSVNLSLKIVAHPDVRAKVILPGGNELVSDEALLRAQTWINVLARNQDSSMSLALISPITMHIHQMRAHLSHIGHPILYDHFYALADGLNIERSTELPFLLHAWRMSFPDPNRVESTGSVVEAPLHSIFLNEIVKRQFDVAEVEAALERIRKRPVWHDYVYLHGSNKQKKRMARDLLTNVNYGAPTSKNTVVEVVASNESTGVEVFTELPNLKNDADVLDARDDDSPIVLAQEKEAVIHAAAVKSSSSDNTSDEASEPAVKIEAIVDQVAPPSESTISDAVRIINEVKSKDAANVEESSTSFKSAPFPSL